MIDFVFLLGSGIAFAFFGMLLIGFRHYLTEKRIYNHTQLNQKEVKQNG